MTANEQPILMPKSKKERIDEINFLRALAILAVVAQHAIGFFARQTDITVVESIGLGLIFNLMKFAVPAFVFATGIVLFYNYTQVTSYSAFIIKRIREVLVPYLFWSVIYLVYYHKVTTLDTAALQIAMKNIITGTSAYHLWFVVMIFQCYLIYPVVLNIFNRIKGSSTRILPIGLALMAVYTGLMWFSSTYLPRYYHNTWPIPVHLFLVEYRDRNFLYWSFYFIWGGVAGLALAQWRQLITRTKFWWLMIFGGLFTLVSYQLLQSLKDNMINLGYATSFKPSMFFYTIAHLILVYGLSYYLTTKDGRLGKILHSVGKYSFGIYLSHALILNYVILTLKPWLLKINYLAGFFLVTVLTSLIAYLLTRVLAKLPLSWLTVGVTRK